jgi:hypothetical protein
MSVVKKASPEYLFVELSSSETDGVYQNMPSSADEFMNILSNGERPLWSGYKKVVVTDDDYECLNKIINVFNNLEDNKSRMLAICEYMVDCSAIETGTSRYEIIKIDGDKIYMVEDYPNGSESHVMSLAVGVLRWCRFTSEDDDRLSTSVFKLLATKFDTEGERYEKLVAMGLVTQPVVTQPVVTQPVVTQPVVTQPVVTQPVLKRCVSGM